MNKKVKHTLTQWLNRGLNLFLLGFGSALLWVLLQVFCFSSFSIPTDSMEPGLLAGDVVLVNKWNYGARLFQVMDAIEGKQVDIYRLPGTSEIERNDVVVFNNPCPKEWLKMEMDVMQYYIKRCIALPGDSLEIRNARYHVRGYEGTLGNAASQNRLAAGMNSEQGVSRLKEQHCYYAYPFDSLLAWNIHTLGPLYVPRKGDCIAMNRTHAVLYKPLIEWEQNSKLTLMNGRYLLRGQEITTYTFLKNYYFMGGDKTDNSRDSRYWGLLPEEYIVGKAWRVWKSVDKNRNTIRWERIWKSIE